MSSTEHEIEREILRRARAIWLRAQAIDAAVFRRTDGTDSHDVCDAPDDADHVDITSLADAIASAAASRGLFVVDGYVFDDAGLIDNAAIVFRDGMLDAVCSTTALWAWKPLGREVIRERARRRAEK
jgi:hypothetical protein